MLVRIVNGEVTRPLARLGMLVLSRKKNESIHIGDGVTVTVVEIRGDRVRLGIVAPKEVLVHRQEVQDEIDRKAKEQAGTTKPTDSPST